MKLTPKQYLKQAYRLNELIETDLAELSRLKALSTAISGVNYSPDKVQNGNFPGSKLENTVVKIIDLENVIDKEIDRFVDLKREIRGKICRLENPDEQLILRYRYLVFLSWREIQAKMGLQEREVFNLHSKALQHFPL